MRKGKWISRLTVATLLVVFSLTTASLPANHGGYGFTLLAFLGAPAPGGGFFINDFEPWGLNHQGEVAFGADLALTPDGEFIGEGIFVASSRLSQIVRVGQEAPGGGTFDQIFWAYIPINDTGDVAFTFALSPFSFPAGVNSGVYRFTRSAGTVTPVMVPEVTPAPGGGVFKGAFIYAGMNHSGDIVFAGMVPASIGPGASLGLGQGIFRADTNGQIVKVVSPGDPAPGGGTFDYASESWIKDAGDVAFSAHSVGEECVNFGAPPEEELLCLSGVYLRNAATGEIQRIVNQGEMAPGGGVFRFASVPILNNRGEIVFVGDLTEPPGVFEHPGVFLYSGGQIIPVARPGDEMPGGGTVVSAGGLGPHHLNNRGEVVFAATLDTDEDADGVPDAGVYVWSGGSLSLVARTGTVIPGVGTIVDVASRVEGGRADFAKNNDRGQVALVATLTDGRTVLLLATPK